MKSLAVLCLLAVIAHSTLAKPQESAPGQEKKPRPVPNHPQSPAPEGSASDRPKPPRPAAPQPPAPVDRAAPGSNPGGSGDAPAEVGGGSQPARPERPPRPETLAERPASPEGVNPGEAGVKPPRPAPACPVKGQIKDASGACVCRQGSALNADGSKCERVKQN